MNSSSFFCLAILEHLWPLCATHHAHNCTKWHPRTPVFYYQFFVNYYGLEISRNILLRNCTTPYELVQDQETVSADNSLTGQTLVLLLNHQHDETWTENIFIYFGVVKQYHNPHFVGNNWKLISVVLHPYHFEAIQFCVFLHFVFPLFSTT